MSTLTGKTAVVTGAAGPMGLAVVRNLLEDGAQVALVDIDAMRLARPPSTTNTAIAFAPPVPLAAPLPSAASSIGNTALTGTRSASGTDSTTTRTPTRKPAPSARH